MHKINDIEAQFSWTQTYGFLHLIVHYGGHLVTEGSLLQFDPHLHGQLFPVMHRDCKKYILKKNLIYAMQIT